MAYRIVTVFPFGQVSPPAMDVSRAGSLSPTTR